MSVASWIHNARLVKDGPLYFQGRAILLSWIFRSASGCAKLFDLFHVPY